MRAIALGGPSLAPCRRCRLSATVMVCSKGFGKEDAPVPSGPALNKRGKVSSRPGIPPREMMGAQEVPVAQEAMGQEEEERTELPQVVGDRMLRRMAIFAGIPFAGSLLFFPAFYYVKVVLGVDVPSFVVYAISVAGLGGSLLGISYGVLSTSWDPRREGTFLGAAEFRSNLPALMQRLGRK